MDQNGALGMVDVFAVVGAQTLDHIPTVGEQLSGDMRAGDAGVFRLDVEAHPSVTDVVVETREGRRRAGHVGPSRAGPRESRDDGELHGENRREDGRDIDSFFSIAEFIGG
jgi:hypothetical protein